MKCPYYKTCISSNNEEYLCNDSSCSLNIKKYKKELTERRGVWIDGHSYISEYEGHESAYHNLKCEVCGKVSKGNK